MVKDRLRQSLKRLGIPPEDYQLLKLLPLIYVAWSDGSLEASQKERIRQFAARHLDPGVAGQKVLSRWLEKKPSRAYIEEGLHDIFFLARAVDDPGVEFSELPELLAYAEAVARSTARGLDRPEAVSANAESALEEVARELQIDHGRSWAKLLRELDTRRAGRGKNGGKRKSAATSGVQPSRPDVNVRALDSELRRSSGLKRS